jgi:hypothetical protein
MKKILVILSVFILATVPAVTFAESKTEVPEYTVEGLKLVPNTKNIARVWAEPGADLSQYKRVFLVEPYVAFRKDWKRDQNRGLNQVSNRDMERIKANVKELFIEVFTEELEKGGYQLANERAEDVLMVKPAIIDLDVVAPNTLNTGVTRTFSESAGSMTLYVELYDSVTDDLLAKALDAKSDRSPGWIQYQTGPANRAAAIKMMQPWAEALVQGLDQAREVSQQDEE